MKILPVTASRNIATDIGSSIRKVLGVKKYF